MRTQRILAALLAAGLSSGTGDAAPSGARDTKAEILRRDAEWAEAAAKRDVERVLAFWSEDATVFPPGRPALVGKAAIREYVEESFRIPGFGISWKTTSVVVSRAGDFAYASGTNRVTFQGADGKPVAVEGKAVTVWRREGNGDWKCVVDIWNDASPPKQ